MTRSIVKCTRADWANILIGLWVIVSPFALDFARNSGLRWDNIAVGVAVVLLTFAAGKVPLVRGAIVLLGGWLLISPLILGFSSTIVSWNNLVMGLLIVIGTILAESMPPMDVSPVNSVK